MGGASGLQAFGTMGTVLQSLPASCTRGTVHEQLTPCRPLCARGRCSGAALCLHCTLLVLEAGLVWIGRLGGRQERGDGGRAVFTVPGCRLCPRACVPAGRAAQAPTSLVQCRFVIVVVVWATVVVMVVVVVVVITGGCRHS